MRPINSQTVLKRVDDILILIRFSVIGTTILFLLMGAVAADPQLGALQVFGLTLVAIAFHIYAYVLNDVIDLPVDRTQPDRADSPLVQGRISSIQALVFALIQLPIMIILTMLMHGSTLAYIFLALSFAQVTAYNIWGKRNPLPMITDFVQGTGWGELGLYGAAMTMRTLNPLNIAVFAFFALYIMLTNGVHGALRDLSNDVKAGMRTTSALLGAHGTESGGVILSTRLEVYAFFLHILLALVTLIPLLLNWFNYPTGTQLITGGVVLALSAGALFELFQLRHAVHSFNTMYLAGALHLALLLAAFLFAFLPSMNFAFLAAVLVSFVIPFLTPRLSWKMPWKIAVNPAGVQEVSKR